MIQILASLLCCVQRSLKAVKLYKSRNICCLLISRISLPFSMFHVTWTTFKFDRNGFSVCHELRAMD